MANVNITFNGKEFLLSCDDGQEEHLVELSEQLNNKFANLKSQLGNIGENKLLLITSIKVMDEYFERTARSFSTFVNILDPEVIVCGGGMSEIDELYDEVPKRIIPYIASNFFLTPMVKAEHGSSSGVRGAAYLWG